MAKEREASAGYEEVEEQFAAPPKSFFIPSLYDNVELECRLYHPKTFPPNRGAVFAHPYAPLGGTCDDVVVQAAASELVANDYLVGTFNFRGAGASRGRTSWTGKPELLDYWSFTGFILFYIHFASQSPKSLAPTSGEGGFVEYEHGNGIHFISGGYSYGALITIQLPPLTKIIERFTRASQASPEAEILRRAWRHCKEDRVANSAPPRFDGLVTSSAEDGGQNPRVRLEDSPGTPKAGEIQISQNCYLLVSPVLPPLSWAVALPIANIFGRRPGNADKSPGADEDDSIDKLSQYPTCAIYGRTDQFTSISKLRKWEVKIRTCPHHQLTSSEIAGVGHFWLSERALGSLRESIRNWLRGLV